MANTDRRPNFLYIGPDRAGTAWLRRTLAAHPDVFIPYSYELFFFDSNFFLGEDWYLENFVRAKPPHFVIAEASYSYLFAEQAAERIHAMLPDVRLMATLREPVDRALSAYLLLRKLGMIGTSFSDAIDAYPELVDHGRYAKHLRPYYDRFSAERIYTPLFDDLEAAPGQFARDLFQYLGLDPVPLDTGLDQPINPAAAPRNPPIARLASRGAAIVRRIGMPDLVTAIQSSSIVENALYRPLRDDEKPEIDRETRTRLMDMFRDDVHELAELTGRDVVGRWGY